MHGGARDERERDLDGRAAREPIEIFSAGIRAAWPRSNR